MEANHDPEGRICEKMGLPPGNFDPGYMDERRQEADVAYTRLLLHILGELKSLGFKVVVVMAGHYPLLNHARLKPFQATFLWCAQLLKKMLIWFLVPKTHAIFTSVNRWIWRMSR